MILSKKKYDKIDPDFLISERLGQNNPASFLVIVPTNRKSRALKKEFINASGGKVTGKLNIETLGTFSQKMFSVLNPEPLQFLSEAAAAVLLKKCFGSAHLKYFNQYKSEVPSGTLERIKNIISEYKRHAVSPEHLFSEAEKLDGSEKLKAADIALIYKLYNEECKKSSSGEMGDIYEGILNKAQKEFKEKFFSLYPSVDLIVINGFDEFTIPEVEIINRTSECTELFLSFDYNDNNPGLFLHLKDSFQHFRSRGFITIDQSIPDNKNIFREIIRNEYFKASSAKHDFYITELVGLDREREVELIAKEIKEILNTGIVEPNRICVVFNLIQNYSPVIRDKFPLFGIPFNLTDRIPLSSAGPVTAIITFLEIQENNFYYKSIFRALSSGFINLKNVFLSDMIWSAAELNIISGYDTWINNLKEALPFAGKNQIYAYTRALESISSLQKILSPLSGKMTISEFRENFYRITDNLDITGNILSFKGDTETFIRALASFFEIINELFILLESEYGDKERFPLKFYLDQIRTAAENSRYNILEKPGFGVQITNLDEIRGLSYDYLFVGGMIDGELPTRYQPEIFYSGAYLREEWKHQVEERYRFYQSLCTWEKGLYLTRALQDENKELVPSNFLSELKNHFSIKEKTEKDFTDKIYSIEEMQDFAGKNISYHELFDHPAMPDLENIINSINIYNERNNPDTPSIFNGNIYPALSEELKNKLQTAKDKEYSATQLEVYAQCPFKFFLQKILYLNIPEEPTEEIESRELGGLIHTILYRFYKSVKDKNIIIGGCTDADFKIAEDIMFNTADDVINELTGKSSMNFLDMEKLKGLNGNRKKSVLYNFLLSERENSSGFIPYDFEVPFGNIKNEGEHQEANNFLSGEVKLRGKIDRIDLDDKGGRIRVIDYKSGGRKPSADELEKGISLQLPLYLYAASVIVKQKLGKEYNPSGADIYSLKYQKSSFGKKSIINEKKKTEDELTEEYNRLIDITRDSIDRYIKNISNGMFNLSTLDGKKKVCAYCDFVSICRVSE